MQEQMVETRAWKKARGLQVESAKCRLCGKFDETVNHLLAGCKVLAGKEYLRRHNNALMILAVEWVKKEKILNEEEKWYNTSWMSGTVLERGGKKLIWDFEFKMRRETTARRPDLVLEDADSKCIWIVDMACPMDENVVEKFTEKLRKYEQLAFETREKRHGYSVNIVPVIVGCTARGGKELIKQIRKVIEDDEKVNFIASEMIRTVLCESETILRKDISGIIQPDQRSTNYLYFSLC